MCIRDRSYLISSRPIYPSRPIPSFDTVKPRAVSSRISCQSIALIIPPHPLSSRPALCPAIPCPVACHTVSSHTLRHILSNFVYIPYVPPSPVPSTFHPLHAVKSCPVLFSSHTVPPKLSRQISCRDGETTFLSLAVYAQSVQ